MEVLSLDMLRTGHGPEQPALSWAGLDYLFDIYSSYIYLILFDMYSSTCSFLSLCSLAIQNNNWWPSKFKQHTKIEITVHLDEAL